MQKPHFMPFNSFCCVLGSLLELHLFSAHPAKIDYSTKVSLLYTILPKYLLTQSLVFELDWPAES